MALFNPTFEGHLTIEPLPEDFTAQIERRVREGLFSPGRRDRANYQVRSRDVGAITFEAQGLLTIYNIGLNEVTVSRRGRNEINYQVSYWGWTRMAVIQSALLGMLLAAFYVLLPALRRDVASYPFGAALFWSMIAFWSLLWPWIISALHKGPAERALQRILRVTLSGDTPQSGQDRLSRAS